jgi:hypothetical protein
MVEKAWTVKDRVRIILWFRQEGSVNAVNTGLTQSAERSHSA